MSLFSVCFVSVQDSWILCECKTYFSVLLQPESSLLGPVAPAKVGQTGRDDGKGHAVAALLEICEHLGDFNVRAWITSSGSTTSLERVNLPGQPWTKSKGIASGESEIWCT